ncbi:tumor necrosis factor receptor superfamily member 1B-like [Python bivittatus]|uniref:Tumor necrosis factor receptor superfamily member 1B-like n=1 Tax=Python bivittatus TaxID=176946 RepID=A0A9F5N5T9_PYTBI|nr:tumor necrosis factor receptor superfamily member 1B-like [Python bivittatus]
MIGVEEIFDNLALAVTDNNMRLALENREGHETGRRQLRIYLKVLSGLRTTQAYVLPYSPSQAPHCLNPGGEYYEENIHKCCSLCPPGFRVLQSCNSSANTQCIECKEGLYTKAWSRARLCFSCSPHCKAGFVEEKKCTRTQNRACWCPPEHFCSSFVSEKCYNCQPYQKCPKGYGVVRAGTRRADVECAPCRPGTFSDLESPEAVCTPHRICKSVLVPGNSSSNTICRNSGGHIDLRTTSLRLTTTTKRPMPPWHVGTRNATLSVKKDLLADTGRIAGMIAIPLLLGVIICFIGFKKSGQNCAPLCNKEKQPFSSPEKLPSKWPQDPRALGQEKDSLLQRSISSSLDSPPGSEKSSETCDGCASKVEADSVQQRSLPLNDRPCYSRTDSRISGNGKTHVNVSCVVSICNSGHDPRSPALNGSGTGEPSDHADLPLSQEETAMKRESGRQTAVEVEDSMDFFDSSERKSLPLSIQDAGMKTS